MQNPMSDYLLGVSDGDTRPKISLLTMTAAQGPQTSPSLTTCRHFWWTVFFCQRQPVCEEKRDRYRPIGYYCLDLYKQSLMHMNIISFHPSATHNRNTVKGPSPRLCKCPRTIIKRDGLWLIGEEKSNQIVLALSPYFKDFDLRQIEFMVDIRN